MRTDRGDEDNDGPIQCASAGRPLPGTPRQDVEQERAGKDRCQGPRVDAAKGGKRGCEVEREEDSEPGHRLGGGRLGVVALVLVTVVARVVVLVASEIDLVEHGEQRRAAAAT